MTNNNLSLEQMIIWKKQIDAGSSLAIFKDDQTGKLYVPKSTTEFKSGFFTDLEDGKVFITNQTQGLGLCSVDNQRLSTGVNQLVYAVRVRAATLGAATSAALIASPFAGTPPGYFLNGIVKANQGSELMRITGSDITNIKASTSNDDDFKSVVPFALRENTPFNFTFTLAAAAVALDAYKLEWRTVEFVEVSKA